MVRTYHGLKKRIGVDYRWRWLPPSLPFERMRRFGRKGLTTSTICTPNGTLSPPDIHVLLILLHCIPLCLCFCRLHCCLCHPGCSTSSLLILIKLVLILQLFNQLLELWTSYNLGLAIKEPMLSLLMQLVLALLNAIVARVIAKGLGMVE